MKTIVEPLYIRVHPEDNVAIVANPEGLPAGAAFPCGLRLAEAVPQSHKLALHALEEGAPVVRYGQVIGFAARALPLGAWVREDAIRMPEAPCLDELPLATDPPAPLPPLEGYTFEGYINSDGSVGTRNLLGIATTVQCVAPTVEYAARRIRTEILPHFPNVDGVEAITHPYGCGVAIDAPGAAVPIATLGHISRHANLGGVPLAVSLGCEKLQPVRLFPEGAPPVVRMQEEQGFAASVAAIMRAAERRLAELDRRRRTTCPAASLIVGLQCGGSDAFSGVTANPAVGYAADLLVRAGATVMFSEVTEVRDAIHLLTPRAANPGVARALIREMRWYDDYLRAGAADRSANPTPGNKRGGLANVVEKALGSVAKAGSTAIMAVATHGERVRSKGLVFAATPRRRLDVRHPAACFHEHARVHHRRRLPVWPGHGAGDQGLLPHGAGRAVAGPDRHRRRTHRYRPRHHRGNRLGDLPLDPGRGQRPQAHLGGTLGAGQRVGAVQPRPCDLAINRGRFHDPVTASPPLARQSPLRTSSVASGSGMDS